MKYSMDLIKASLSDKKKKEDSLLGIYVHRPLSYPVTLLCLNLGMSAWTASILSVFIGFAGCMMICANSVYFRWAGIILLNLWSVFDCVDGNIARVTKTQSAKGSFMDAESGYVVCAFIYLAFGMAAYHTGGSVIFDDTAIYIFIGAIASVSDVLSRLIHQKYMSAVKSNNTDEGTGSKLGRIRKKVSTEIGIAGFVIVGAILAEVFDGYAYLTLFFGVFNFLSLVLVIAIYSNKARTN